MQQPLPHSAGVLLAPSLTGFSLRSWSGNYDTLFDAPFFVLLDDNGVPCSAALGYPHSFSTLLDEAGDPVGQAMHAAIGQAGEALEVDLLIAARGRTFDDSAVEITALVTNAGAVPVVVGGRMAWFVNVWNYIHIAWTPSPQDGAPEPWRVSEEEFTAPPFGHLILADSRVPGTVPATYFSAVSCNGPERLQPPPTPPARIAFCGDPGGAGRPWLRRGPFDTCFDWHVRDPPPSDPPGVRGGPEAIAYWWGDTPANAIVLLPGESTRFTVWEWAYLENPVTCDAGAPVVAECAGPATAVALDGSGSMSSGGSTLQFEWSCADPRVTFDDPTLERPTASFPGPGTYAVTLLAGVGPYERSCDTQVEVRDTTAPVLVVDAPVSILSSTLDGCRARVALESSAADACDATPTITHVTIPDVGSGGATADHEYGVSTTRVVFTARDASGNETVAETSVTILDDEPPAFVRLTADPASLWPPNHRYHAVHVDLESADECDPAPRVELVRAASSEPTDARGDGRTLPDIQGATPGTDDRDVRVRAERSGTGAGRTYTFTYRLTDAAGNGTEADAVVRVEHDRRTR